MPRTLTWSALLSVILLAACARDDGGTPRSERRGETAASAAASPDPCAIAPTPHAETDATDQDITRFQELARRCYDSRGTVGLRGPAPRGYEAERAALRPSPRGPDPALRPQGSGGARRRVPRNPISRVKT